MGRGAATIVTDHCLATGRTFSVSVADLLRDGRLPHDDPRARHAGIFSMRPVASRAEDNLATFARVLEAMPDTADLRTWRALAQRITRREPVSRQEQRDMAALLEGLSCDAASGRITGLPTTDLVGAAACICDSVVLRERHAEERRFVSGICARTKIPPEEVMAGMLRLGIAAPGDFRSLAVIDRIPEEFNTLDRDTFYKTSGKLLTSGLDALPSTLDPACRDAIEASLRQLADVQSGRGSARNREIRALNATALLAEGIGLSLSGAHHALRLELGGAALSAAARSQHVRREWTTTLRRNTGREA